MGHIETQIKYPNRLRRARKRLGLGEKQIAKLLGVTQVLISYYEDGVRLPSLKNALLLEEIYDTPIRLLYPSLSRQLRQKVQEKIARNAIAYQRLLIRDLEPQEFCTYLDVFDNPSPSQLDIDKLRRHITTTTRR